MAESSGLAVTCDKCKADPINKMNFLKEHARLEARQASLRKLLKGNKSRSIKIIQVIKHIKVKYSLSTKKDASAFRHCLVSLGQTIRDLERERKIFKKSLALANQRIYKLVKKHEELYSIEVDLKALQRVVKKNMLFAREDNIESRLIIDAFNKVRVAEGTSLNE